MPYNEIEVGMSHDYKLTINGKRTKRVTDKDGKGDSRDKQEVRFHS